MQATRKPSEAACCRNIHQPMTTAELGLLIGSTQMPEWDHGESCCRLSRLIVDVLDSILIL